MPLAPFAAEEKAIQARFAALWNQGLYKVKWQGAHFDQPAGAKWVALVLLPGRGERVDLGSSGNPRFRYAGLVYVQCFCPESLASSGQPSARAQALDLADLVPPIFHELTLTTESGGRILFRATSVEDVGVDKAGLYQVNAVTPYVRDELRAPAT